MNNVAQFAPYEYVQKLHALTVPGYTGYPGGVVEITKYLSANPMFGGRPDSPAAILSTELQRIIRSKPEASLTKAPGFDRVFTGQGSRDNIINAMSIVNKYQAEFKAVSTLAKYFKTGDFLQEMCDDACFGLDCIGFVGTYLVDAGLETTYTGRRPLDFTALFQPVKSLAEITDYSVVMLTSGLHIQMIDTVNERKSDSIVVDLCQSTKGGPQTNEGVTIRSGGGDYLPVEQFRAALNSKQYAQENADDNEVRKQQGLKTRDYETYLRAKLTVGGKLFGFCGGAIFQLSKNGDPANTVGGSVYVGSAKGGLSMRTP